MSDVLTTARLCGPAHNVPGLGRKNEDTLMVRSSLTGRDDEDYFAVFDGHGGKHASRFAADNLHTILSGTAGSPPLWRRYLSVG